MKFNNTVARQIIMKHYLQPQNRTSLSKCSDIKVFHSDVCSDVLNLCLKWEKDILVDAKFNGDGCAIFIAATDIFIELALNKTKEEIKSLAKLFEKFVKTPSSINNIELSKIKELWVFNNVNKHLNRVICSLLVTRPFV